MAKTVKQIIDKTPLIVLIVGGVLGLIASFVLSVEALTLAKNPDAVLTCSVSIVLNCATVANDASSTLFGFPNSYIGMMTLPVLITVGVAALAGARFPRWFMRAAWIGALAGVVFAGWMFYQSYFVIQVLCPWCLLTDTAMLLIAYGVFRYAAREKALCFMPEKMAEFSKKNYDLAVLVGIFFILIAAIVLKYGNALFA